MSTPLLQDFPVQTGLKNRHHPHEIFRFNTNQDDVHVVRKWCRDTFGDSYGWALTYMVADSALFATTVPPSVVVIIIYDSHPWEVEKIKVMLALKWL